MKEVEIEDATASLAEYARAAVNDEPVILTRRGKPVAAVVSLKGIDRDSLALSQSAAFRSIIARSRARHEAEGGLSAAEMRRRLGIAARRRAAPRPRKASKR